MKVQASQIGGVQHESSENKSNPWIRTLFKCGVLSSLFYIAMNVFIPMFYPGFSSFSQAVSELSAIDSPTRTAWVVMVTLHSMLVIAFGCGIWIFAHDYRRLRGGLE